MMDEIKLSREAMMENKIKLSDGNEVEIGTECEFSYDKNFAPEVTRKNPSRLMNYDPSQFYPYADDKYRYTFARLPLAKPQPESATPLEEKQMILDAFQVWWNTEGTHDSLKEICLEAFKAGIFMSFGPTPPSLSPDRAEELAREIDNADKHEGRVFYKNFLLKHFGSRNA